MSSLVLSPIITRPVAKQQHRVSWWWWWGGPGHYVVNPTRVEVELGCDNNQILMGVVACNILVHHLVKDVITDSQAKWEL